MKKEAHLYRHRWSLRMIALLLGSIAPLSASAFDGTGISNIFTSIVDALVFSDILIASGALALSVAGITLLTSQDEGALSKARLTLFAVITGGVIVVIVKMLGPQFTEFFLAPDFASNSGTVSLSGATGIGTELGGPGGDIGIAGWLGAIGGVLGVLMVIVSVAIAMVSFGNEESYGKAKMSILTSLFGTLVILGSNAINDTVYIDGTPNLLFDFAIGKIEILLGLISIVAVALLVYAGFRLIVSLGDESALEEAKGLLLRVLLGILIIVISYTLVYTVRWVFEGAP